LQLANILVSESAPPAAALPAAPEVRPRQRAPGSAPPAVRPWG